MMRRVVRCGLLLLGLMAGSMLHALEPSAAPWLKQYGSRAWNAENGLPQNTVRGLAQTQDGYLWAGTDEGLVRLNGNDLAVFNTANTPQMQSNLVQSLLSTRDGALWISTTNGLIVYRARQFQRIDVAAGLPSAVVAFAREDRAGRVWVSTAAGVCVMRQARCERLAALGNLIVDSIKQYADAGDNSFWIASGSQLLHLAADDLHRLAAFDTGDRNTITALALDANENLLVGTSDGLLRYREGILTRVPLAGSAKRIEIRKMLAEPDGAVWLGTSSGLMVGHANQYAPVVGIPPVAVQTLQRDKQGALWIGTSRGLLRLAKGQLSRFHSGDALAAAAILTTLEDREGTLWLGTELDGLLAIRHQAFTTYSSADGLSADAARSVMQDAHGTLWIGTDGGGLDHSTANGFIAVTSRNGLSSDVVLSLAGVPNGDVWVGTPTGLNRIRGGVVKVFTTSDGVADDFIRSLCVDAGGAVWIGTRHGLTRYAGESFTSYSTLDGLGGDFIGAMTQRRNGDLLIATPGGLTVMHKGQFHNYPPTDRGASSVVTAIFEDAQGTVWLGSNGSGLSRLDGTTLTPVQSAKLPRTIYGILEDDRGYLWLSAHGGIYRVRMRDLQTAIATHTDVPHLDSYDTTDGMRIGEGSGGGHPAAYRMRDGTLWFTTMRGVSTTDPANLPYNSAPPSVVIETLLIDGVPRQQIELQKWMEIAPGKHRVEFQYAGLTFVAPQKVRYRYKLEGFDREWIEAGRQRSTVYTNLAPGKYFFRVAAMNSDGVWSEADATSALRIRPFFYQTGWFYGLLLLSIAAAAYLVYWWRVHQVEAVFATVLVERNRIAREIHDTLAQSVVGISLQLELLSRMMPAAESRVREQLETARRMVRQSLADARSSIWELRSEGATAEELPSRITKMLRQLGGDSGVHTDLEVTGTYRAQARAVEDELLRIAQEATTNALRHARCSRIVVELRYALKELQLEVADDGIGFRNAANKDISMGHYGVQGMRERAERIAATFDIITPATGGSVVRVALAMTE